MPIRLFDTLTKSKVTLQPLDGKQVRMYTCGPTVYHFAHIGNLRTYIFEDTLKRVILYNGLKAFHVMNITDVGHLTSDADEGEDKMEKGSRREGKSTWDIAKEYTAAFQDDMKKLNITDPDIWCKATDHIQEQIEQVQQLERKGVTYIIDDGVYFDTSKIDDYGKLASLDVESLKAGARVQFSEGKRNPTDFALWKFSPKDSQRQMEWDSPWGRGFPGWHIECSAMAIKYLGEQFDIHCGGIDHIAVHHTNEIAQAETATGKKPWVQLWLHSGFLVNDKGKMAKSGDSFLTMQTLIDKQFDPIVYRYFCLTATYDQQISFSWEALESASNSYNSLKTKIIDLQENKQGNSTPDVEIEYKAAFLDAINDNLNMPKALAVLWGMLRNDNLANERKLELAKEFDAVFGLRIDEIGTEEIPENILQIARERHDARSAKDWKRSDELRDEINALGYVIDDKGEKYHLRKK